MSYIEINDLGSFANINALWAAYPEGGHEGDYCTIGSVKYHWDKYDRMWVASPNYGPTPARDVSTFDGDVNILNNLTVAGTIRAKGINNPGVGYFSSLAALEAKYPYPEVGWWAIVDDTIPGEIYHCVTEGEWTDSEHTGGAGEIELTDYVHKLDLYDLTNYGSDSLETGYFYYMGGGVGQTMAENPTVDDNNRFGCGRIEVQEGDKLVVSSAGGGTFCAWALTGTDRVILSVAAPNTDTTESPVELTAEQDGYLYYNCLLTHIESFFVKLYRSLIEGQLANVEDQIASVEGRFSSMMGDTVYDDSALVDGKVWKNIDVEYVPEEVSWYSYSGCMYLVVHNGDRVVINTRSNSWHATSWCVTDTTRKILESGPKTDSAISKTLDIMQDGYVFINCANDYYSSFEVTHHHNTVLSDIEELKEEQAALAEEVKMAGKSIGVVEVPGTTPTQVLSSNTYYKFTGAITSLTATLGAAASGVVNIYSFSFVAGTNNPTINLPPNVAVDVTVTIKQGDYVEYTIINNKAACKIWTQTT